MKVFLVGGTGVLGRRLIPGLTKAGHEVNVLSRSEKNYELISSLGGNPVSGDIFNKDELIKVSEGNEIFLHMATSIPSKTRPKASDWEMNARLRSEGVENLIAAAINANSKLYVQQSITFHYGHTDGEWVDETKEITMPVKTYLSIPQDLHDLVYRNAMDMENLVLDAKENENLPAVILRYGWFYSYDSSNIPAFVSRAIPIVGGGKSYWNIISVDDAVNAILKVIEKHEQALSDIYNIVEDEPVLSKDFIAYSTKLGSGKNPRKVPKFLARLFVGSYITNFLMSSTKISNAKAKSELEWRQLHSNYQEGIKKEIEIYKSNPSK